jgi:hypothetical protein
MAHSLFGLLTDSSKGDVLSEMSDFRRSVNEVFDPTGRYETLFGFWYRRFGTAYRSHIQGSSNQSFLLECLNVCVSFQILIKIHMKCTLCHTDKL